MRSPTCLLENRAYSPENFLNGGAKDFCNTIGTKPKWLNVCCCAAVGGKAECAGRPARSRWCKSITMKE